MDDSGAPKSTTEDVAALIGRLKREGMQGLIIDLRRDGGGSLDEAIKLTGLFIPRGPVVQAKDPNGKITVSQDTDPGVAYSGPLVVLMNRLSASASEIFAAALQDYGRAVIVGDERSFGKGTVQTVLKIGQLMPFFSLGSSEDDSTKAGALKLTIQKFYRVKGGSTQLKGVESDIILPSLSDQKEFGEGSLSIASRTMRWPGQDHGIQRRRPTRHRGAPSPLSAARRRRPRVCLRQGGHRPHQGEDREEHALAQREGAKGELDADKTRKEHRDAERLARGPVFDVKTYEVRLDDVSAPKLRPVAYNRKPDKAAMAADDDETTDSKKPEVPQPDPIRDEALRIMRDYINLNRQDKTASVQPEKTMP